MLTARRAKFRCGVDLLARGAVRRDHIPWPSIASWCWTRRLPAIAVAEFSRTRLPGPTVVSTDILRNNRGMLFLDIGNRWGECCPTTQSNLLGCATGDLVNLPSFKDASLMIESYVESFP